MYYNHFQVLFYIYICQYTIISPNTITSYKICISIENRQLQGTLLAITAAIISKVTEVYQNEVNII